MKLTIMEKLIVVAIFGIVFAGGWTATDFVKHSIRSQNSPEPVSESRFSTYYEVNSGITIRVLTDKKTGAEYIVINGNAIIQTK